MRCTIILIALKILGGVQYKKEKKGDGKKIYEHLMAKNEQDTMYEFFFKKSEAQCGATHL